MPVISPNAPTVNVQLPVPTPVQQRHRAQPVPAAARPTLQPPPPMAPQSPPLRAVLLPWKVAAKAALPRRRLRRAGGVAKLACVRRKPADYAGFIRHLFENPDDTTAASALADWFGDRGMSATEEVIRRFLTTPQHSTSIGSLGRPDGESPWRVGFSNPTTRREQAGPWNSRFYVYAPQATGRMGGDPYTYTNLTFRHPDDRKRALTFGFFGTEAEGARMVDALEREGHEPYHPSGHGHDAFRTARPELFPKSSTTDPPPADPQHLRRRVRRYAASDRAAFEAAIDRDPTDSRTHLAYSDWLRDHGEEDEADFRKAMGEWVGDSMRGRHPQAFLPYDVYPTENNGFTHGIWRSNLPAWASESNAPESVSTNFVERTRQEPHLAYAPNPYWLHWRGRRNMEEGLRRAFNANRQRPQPMRRMAARMSRGLYRQLPENAYYRIQWAGDPLARDWQSENVNTGELEDATSVTHSLPKLAEWCESVGQSPTGKVDVIALHGDHVGTGSDGEPLVVPTEELGRIRHDNWRGRLWRELSGMSHDELVSHLMSNGWYSVNPMEVE